MSRSAALRRALILCATVVFMATPALAQAITASCTVTGTVTAAGTGQKLAGVRVEGYYRDNTNTWGSGSVATDANGQYSLEFSPGDATYFSVDAIDATGTYDARRSPELPINLGETTKVDFVMSKDSRAPVTNLYSDSTIYYLSSKLAGRGPASLSNDMERYAILSDGTDLLEITADDEWYQSTRYWGYYDGSGIKSLGYSVDGGAWTLKTPQTATWVNWYDARPLWLRHTLPALGEGLHSVSFRSTDNNGNVGRTKSQLVVIDKTPPVTSYNKRTATTSNLQLIAKDALIGALSTFVRTGSTGAFRPGTAIHVPASGSQYVQFYSQDKVGNVETVRKLKVSSPASLNKPKASVASVSHGHSFKVSGQVFGRAKATGYLRIYRYDGNAYRYVSRKAFAEGSDGHYRVSLKLKRGSYRFAASYGGYTSTWANPPVRSSRSNRVYVW